jgi:hypothetical protein
MDGSQHASVADAPPPVVPAVDTVKLWRHAAAAGEVKSRTNQHLKQGFCIPMR